MIQENLNFADTLLTSAFDGLKVTDVENTEAVNTMLDKYGLRWQVEKMPLVLPTGEPTGFYGVVRTDTKKTFATCKDSYVPFQNSELAELLIRIADKTGYEIHSGGGFNGGGKVYLQLNTGNEIKNIGKNKDRVIGYVTGINGHDTTQALKWGAVNFTIYCRNTFAMANKALQQSARHTESIHEKVEQSIKQILGISDAEKTIFEQFIKLSEIPAQKEHFAQIVKSITDVDINLPKHEAEKQYSTHARNRTKELLTSIAAETNSKGQSLWGLFSGVTHYTSHVLPVPKRENARLESKYTGTGLSVDNVAFNQVMKFAGISL
jgi:phage/plasmid-like protein (TIGR03299 family)